MITYNLKNKYTNMKNIKNNNQYFITVQLNNKK